MKHFTTRDFGELPRFYRTNLINSISGYKPANLIGTISESKQTNVAIFTSVVHIGANPPLLGFIMRPIGENPYHTYANIKETGVYTINHVHESFAEKAHFTSAKFERDVSEFSVCRLSEEYIENFAAPFVAESKIKIGLRFVEEIPIKINGTILIIGEIEHLILPENALLQDGNVDLNVVEDVCVSGLETYYKATEIAHFVYAKLDEVPSFDRS